MLTTKYEDLPPLAKNIRSHLVLLYDQKNYDVGSGVLIKIKEYIFVLTAAHVLFENLKINLGLPWQSTSLTILTKWIDEELDIGFIEVKPFEVELLKNDQLKAYEIGKKNKTVVQIRKRNIAICGYPYVSHYKVGNLFGFIPLFLGCSLITPENWPKILFDRGKTPQQNIVIPYGRKHGGVFYGIDKKPLESIEPNGLSGCGIWYYITGDESAGNPRYALLGLQTSYFRQSQVLIGTTLEPLINVICTKYNISFRITD